MAKNKDFDQFDHQQYINLETFRRSGAGVPTPVWFVAGTDKLYVRTIANSGKIKRIRNNGLVRIASCDMRGHLSGDWVQAHARVLSADEEGQAKEVNRMLSQKYGPLKFAFDLAGRLQKHRSDTIEIELVD